MPWSELPLKVLFLAFILLFVLIGIYPAWQRSARKIRKFLQTQSQALEPLTELFESPSAEPAQEPPQDPQLDDFELLVLWRLAQNYPKTSSRKQLQNTLHFEPQVLNQTLASLADKQLIQFSVSSLFGLRYALSDLGRRLAHAQGFIPEIHSRT